MKKQPKTTKKPNIRAEAMYKEFVAYLTEKGALESVDLSFVMVCATIGARVEKFERIVEEEGEIKTYPNGAVAPSANYKILVKEREQFSQFCRALGITPQGRQGLSGFGSKRAKTTSKLRSLMDKKTNQAN